MRLTSIFTPLLLIGLIISAQASHAHQIDQQTQRALSLLAGYEPHVNWDPTSALKADFDHDGKADFAFSGTQDGKFIVAIIRNSIGAKPKHWVFRFSIVSPSHKINQICSLDTKIRTRSPVLLGSAKRTWRIPTESKALYLDDGCDPIDVTWNQDKRKFELFRIHVLM